MLLFVVVDGCCCLLLLPVVVVVVGYWLALVVGCLGGLMQCNAKRKEGKIKKQQ